MIRLFLYMIILCFAQISFAADVTTLTLKEKDGITTSNYPLTFGHVFKKGDVSNYVTAAYNGTPVTTQCDVKTTYDDGSVRFAVVSLILPSVVANSSNIIVLSTSTTTASTGHMDKAAILAMNIQDEIRLTNLSGSGYSGSLTADLNAQISSDATPTYWLQGSVATEVLVRQALNASLESSWEVRFYPGTSFGPRISHSIENMNADHRGLIDYSLDIQAGLPTLSSKYTRGLVNTSTVTPSSLTGVTNTNVPAVATVVINDHKRYAGDVITVTGASDPAYNGIFYITGVTGANTYTYLMLSHPAVSTPTGTITVQCQSMRHNENSRWRKVLWLGNEPPETELHYNLPYLISTGAVMNYDTTLTVPDGTIASAYSAWNATNHDIMGNGKLTKYFPTTGGREDIGVLPTWSARYLLTMDNRMREIVLNSGEIASHCPIHYREVDAGKSFFRHPISIDDRPTVWSTSDRVSTYGATADKLPAAIGDFGSIYHGWTIDRAHQGSFAYLPYMITGERYFLDEMYYWASWNLSASDYNPLYGRNYSNGWIRDQTRGEAWSLRNISDAAALGADADIEKSYYTNKINNNITQWMTEKDRYPLNYWGYDSDATTDGLTSDVKYSVSPWQDDFMLLSLTHAKNQGFATKPIIDWYNVFIINRFTHPDFNPFNAALYRFPGKLQDNSLPATWAQAKSLFLKQETSFDASDYPTSYNFVAMAAASTVIEYTNGQNAYNFLKNNVNSQDELNLDPTWGIVPITSGSTCNNGTQDGDETGVDCGGSCTACGTPTLLIPTSYLIPGGVPYGIVQ